MKQVLTDDAIALLLRRGGHRATPGRVSLLRFLARAERPLSIGDILSGLGGTLDQATIYRAMEALADAGVVVRVDLGHGHAHYELLTGERHHHHVVCVRCGRTEDVALCDVHEIERQILARSRVFASIERHALEFFGRCSTCARSRGKNTRKDI